MTDEEAAAFRAQVDNLSVAVETLTADREHYRELYLRSLELVRKLELGITGPKAERLPQNGAQLSMGLLETLLGRAGTPEPKPTPGTVREHELAPLHWKQTLEQPDAQERLAANVFRPVLLDVGEHPVQK